MTTSYSQALSIEHERVERLSRDSEGGFSPFLESSRAADKASAQRYAHLGRIERASEATTVVRVVPAHVVPRSPREKELFAEREANQTVAAEKARSSSTQKQRASTFHKQGKELLQQYCMQ